MPYMVFHQAKIKTLGTDVITQNTLKQCVKPTIFFGVIIDNNNLLPPPPETIIIIKSFPLKKYIKME